MMTRKRTYRLLAIAALSASALAITGCKTVSEDTCLAGNWEAVGFKDGASGKSPDRLAKIAETCVKYGAAVDNFAYLSGYEAGLPKYCTFERGFERGESGQGYKQVCSGALAADYAPGYDEGRARYEIYQQHDQLIDRYQDHTAQLYDVRQRLKNEELTDKERHRLQHKAKRLVREIDELRFEVRYFERLHGLPQSQLTGPY